MNVEIKDLTQKPSRKNPMVFMWELQSFRDRDDQFYFSSLHGPMVVILPDSCTVTRVAADVIDDMDLITVKEKLTNKTKVYLGKWNDGVL